MLVWWYKNRAWYSCIRWVSLLKTRTHAPSFVHFDVHNVCHGPGKSKSVKSAIPQIRFSGAAAMHTPDYCSCNTKLHGNLISILKHTFRNFGEWSSWESCQQDVIVTSKEVKVLHCLTLAQCHGGSSQQSATLWREGKRKNRLWYSLIQHTTAQLGLV